MVYRETSWWWYIVPVLLIIAGGLWWLRPDIGQLLKSQIPTSSLIGHWKFDEENGNTVADSSGKNNNGSINGTLSFKPGKIANALEFQWNLQNLVTVADSTSLNIRPAITLSAWIKPNSDFTEQKYFLWKANQYGLSVGDISGGNLRKPAFFICFDPCNQMSDWKSVIAPSPIDQQWHLITGVYDGGKMQLFVDGEIKGTTVASGNIATHSSSYPLGIGNYANLPNSALNASYYFNGLIDDVRIFNEALTTVHVSTLFSPSTSPSTPSPIAHWKLDDGGKYSDGTGMVADASGNNKHAILTGDVTWIEGKLGKAIQFPGDSSTNLVLIGAGNTVLRQSAAITYAFWAKFPADGGGYVMGTGAQGGSGYGGIKLTPTEGLTFNWTPLNPGNDTVIKSSGYTFSPDTWYHIVFGISYASTDYKMYVNGEEINKTISNSSVGSFYPIEDYNSGYNDYLGGRYVNQGYYFGGAIDDVKIFNTLISSPAVVKAVAGFSSAACFDGVDNDQDGKTDYLNDPGCSGADDVDETDPPSPVTVLGSPPPAVCGNGKIEGTEQCDYGKSMDLCTALCEKVPPNDLIAYFPFDDSTDTPGKYGQAKRNSGTLSFTLPVSPPPVSYYTISGWIKTTAQLASFGDINVYSGKPTLDNIESTIAISDGNWHFIAYTYEKNAVGTWLLTLFVDNKVFGKSFGTGPSPLGDLRSTLVINNTSASVDLDDFRVYNRALQEVEINKIFEGITPPSYACGNGKIEGTEECDDGNVKDGDGCTKLCKAEIGNICQARTVKTIAVSTSPSWLTEATQDSNKHLVFRNFKIFANRVQEGASAHIGMQSITGNISSVPSEIGQGRETLLAPYDNEQDRTSQDYKDYMNVKVELVKDGKVTISVSPWQNDPCKNPQCSNTIDDDIDGKVDFSADKGCTDSKDTDETDPISCGNGKVEGEEKCDDGNIQNGDGCDSRCAYEPFCGNGKIENNEECDDGEKNAETGWCTKECRKNSTTFFVTAKTYKGDLRGITGANAICQLAADSGGLPTKSKIKTWKAFISDDTQKIADLSLPPPYRLLDGTRVADSRSALFSGKIFSPIFRTEEVKNIKEYPDNSGIVWTGSTAEGLLAKDFCKKPTEKTIVQGNVGQATVADKNWLDYGGKTCEENYSVYCYGIGPAVALTPPAPPPVEIGVLPVKNLTIQVSQHVVLPNAVLFDQLTADERKAMTNLYFSPVGAKLIVENNGQEIGSKTASEISIGTFAGPGVVASVKIPNSGIYSFNAEATFIGGKKKIGKFTVTTLRSFALDIRCGKVKLDTKVASCSLYLPKEVIGGKLSLEFPKGSIKAIKDLKKSESLPVTAITILKQKEEGNVFVIDADFLEITRKVFAKDESYSLLEMFLELTSVEADKIPITLKATLRKGSELYPATP